MWVLFLLVAWIAAIGSCGRLCRAAITAARTREPAEREERRGAPGLYEAAYLFGGPRRVTDLALVRLSCDQRILLAHTGYATVVDPHGRDEIERSLISAVGAGGQSPVSAVRAAFVEGEAVRSLADRLTEAGLAVPAAARLAVDSSVRVVRAASVVIVVTFVMGAVLHPRGADGSLVGWFALPLLITLGSLAIAHVEIGPCTRWASPAGQDYLRRFRIPDRGTGGEESADGEVLAAVAVCGPAAVPDPLLRTALRGGRRVASNG
ncbi:TIGR04222 domain-containing membrane protein [Wenjunlia tyrosinilytica]|uniref:Membrane protein n=1 Tax=Wenjunlia tyrosinilytica TaxID=1544741 RepID=A0A917ZUA4_9ACTN|nr:TIGR04222 domain-containing membrane protein [Wenjunlia tyrosinilytica]GGO92182.1 membrane protein [Wenjunlia tyrosinilytica]